MTTEELIALCEAAIVPVDKWHDRDSAQSQIKIGQAFALLKAGAEWRESDDPKTDENTVWIEITYPGFWAFEEGRNDREHWETEYFYIPTAKRLADREGKDWY